MRYTWCDIHDIQYTSHTFTIHSMHLTYIHNTCTTFATHAMHLTYIHNNMHFICNTYNVFYMHTLHFMGHAWHVLHSACAVLCLRLQPRRSLLPNAKDLTKNPTKMNGRNWSDSIFRRLSKLNGILFYTTSTRITRCFPKRIYKKKLYVQRHRRLSRVQRFIRNVS